MQDRHRNSAAKGGQLPGATGGAHVTGLVIAIAVVMALAVPRIRLRLSVPVASPPGQILGLAAADVGAVAR